MAALKEYKKQTKKDIVSHPLATQLKSCDSPNAVLIVLQTQVQTFDKSQGANERWTKLLGPTVNVLYAFSGFISNVTGPVNCETLSRLGPTLTCVTTDSPTGGCDFCWNWCLTSSEYLP